MASRRRASAAWSSGTAVSAGYMARACASARPPMRPRCSAAASTATRRSRLPRLPKTARGDATSRDCRAMRSVDSRSSHRLRMRCELEALLHTVPLHDPGSEMTTAVAYQMRDEARRADAVKSFVALCRKRRRTDDPARRSGGRRIIRRGTQDEAERVAGGGREREPARRHLVDIARAQLADRHADGAAAQRFLHRPQHVAGARGGDRDHMLGRDAGLVETGAVGRAVLGEREILGDPEQASSRHGGASVARRRAWFRRVSGARTYRVAALAARFARQRGTRRQRQREAGSGGGLALAYRRDLMQRAAAESAAQDAVDRGDAERQRGAFGKAGGRLRSEE